MEHICGRFWGPERGTLEHYGEKEHKHCLRNHAPTLTPSLYSRIFPHSPRLPLNLKVISVLIPFSTGTHFYLEFWM